MYDIAILGATAAGYAAACRLAGNGASVIVMDAPSQAAESPRCDWVGSAFFKQTHLPKSLASASGAVAFKRICYHNTDLSLVVPHTSRAIAGHFVDIRVW